VTRWPGGDGSGPRWPGRRPPPAPKEPPAWFRAFVAEDWGRPGDDEVRYPAGARMPPDQVAYRRWLEARRQWAKENGFSVADWLEERHRARRAAMRTDRD
jgi:hypothetical protein